MSGEQETLISGQKSEYVKLNVGGSLFYTTLGVLTKHDTMLRAMFSGRIQVLTDSEGWVLIDRSGKHFGQILNFLRDGSIRLPDDRNDLIELHVEAKYYLVQALVEQCERILNLEAEPEPRCLVPYITSTQEEDHIIRTSKKPVVKFLCNRHNNKYSYTSNSDENFLRNIELFDKLALRYSEKMLFVKDVLGGSEICQWSFYGRGKKLQHVCCTSIVYGTDKKHTKVDFPEAKIYEETLFLTLFDNPNKEPDMELLQATRGRDDGDAARRK